MQSASIDEWATGCAIITSRLSGKILEVENTDQADATNVVQCNYLNGDVIGFFET